MKLRWKIAAILTGLLAIAFFLLGALNLREIRGFEHRLVYVNESKAEAMTEEMAEEGQRNNQRNPGRKMSFTFWGQSDVASITASDLQTEIPAPVVLVCGRTDLLFKGGAVLDVDEKEKCLLGSHTAAALFGGTDVVGLTVDYGGKRYTIAGILPEVRQAFVVQADKRGEQVLDRAVVEYGDPLNRSVIKTEFEERYSPGTAVDYDLLTFFAELAAMLLPLIIGITLLREVAGYARGSAGRKRFLLWIVFTAAFALLLTSVLFNLDVPPELLPAKWSDFDFWSSLWQSQKESLALWLRQPKYPPDLLYVIPFIKTIGYAIMGIIWYSCMRACYKRSGVEDCVGFNFRTYWKNLRKRCGGGSGF